MNISRSNIVIILVAFGLFIAGYFIGYNYGVKKQKTLLVQTEVHDTSYSSYPIEVEKLVSVPKNVIINKDVVRFVKYDSISCDTFYNQIPLFASTDTLRFDSLFVAISDTGNCYGVINRHSVFGGFQKERIITNTITNTITKPISLFQLNAGVGTTLSSDYKFVDVSPMLQLIFKQKAIIGYGYRLNERSHNIQLTTKLK